MVASCNEPVGCREVIHDTAGATGTGDDTAERDDEHDHHATTTGTAVCAAPGSGGRRRGVTVPGEGAARPTSQPDLGVESQLLVASWSDPLAFGELYARTCADLTRWFAPRALDPEIVADLVAETYAELLSSRRRFSPRRGHARQFLWGIAHHQLAGWRRRGHVERRWRERAAIAVEPVASDAFADTDTRLDEQVAVAIVQTALDDLSATERRALLLRIGEQHPYDVVAAELGCSVGAARVRVSRALAKLSARFADQIDQELP